MPGPAAVPGPAPQSEGLVLRSRRPSKGQEGAAPLAVLAPRQDAPPPGRSNPATPLIPAPDASPEEVAVEEDEEQQEGMVAAAAAEGQLPAAEGEEEVAMPRARSGRAKWQVGRSLTPS